VLLSLPEHGAALQAVELLKQLPWPEPSVAEDVVALLSGKDRMDGPDSPTPTPPGAACPPAPADDRLFHVLYTSGSTAMPKGVCGTHGQMRARLAWLWRTFPLADDELVCHKTALHFVDASLEIFGTLLQGRPLLIARESDSASPARFIELLAAHGATRLSLVVSQLRALLLADRSRRQQRQRIVEL